MLTQTRPLRLARMAGVGCQATRLKGPSLQSLRLSVRMISPLQIGMNIRKSL